MSHIYMLFFLQEESLYTDYFTKYIIEESLYTDYSTKYIISLLNVLILKNWKVGLGFLGAINSGNQLPRVLLSSCDLGILPLGVALLTSRQGCAISPACNPKGPSTQGPFAAQLPGGRSRLTSWIESDWAEPWRCTHFIQYLNLDVQTLLPKVSLKGGSFL